MPRRVLRTACRIGLVAVIGAVAVGFRSAGTGNPTAAAIVRALDKVEVKYASQLVGMCVGAVDGPVTVAKCYGKKAPGTKARVTTDTLFLIDSVTKTFTATLLALRVEQHSLQSLDDPVRTSWPAGADKADIPKSLTFRDLAQHYSGLPAGTTPSSPDLGRFFETTAQCLARPSCRNDVPGGSYLYSNRGFALLGDLLALHDGFFDGPLGPWEQDNWKSIAKPLGMTSTKTWLDWQASDPLYYQTHRAIAHGTDHWAGQPYGDPAGGLYSSAHDMSRWLRYSMGLSGSPALRAAHHWLYDDVPLRPEKTAGRQIGLAWNVQTTTGTPCVQKDGGGLGFSAFVLFVEHRRRGVFVLLNNSPATPVWRIARDALNALPATPGAGSPTC